MLVISFFFSFFSLSLFLSLSLFFPFAAWLFCPAAKMIGTPESISNIGILRAPPMRWNEGSFPYFVHSIFCAQASASHQGKGGEKDRKEVHGRKRERKREENKMTV